MSTLPQLALQASKTPTPVHVALRVGPVEPGQPGSASYLGSLSGTFVIGRKSHGIPWQRELPFDFRTAYHLAMEPIAKSLEARKTKWGADRARSIQLDPEQRVDTCEVRAVTVRCGCRHVRIPVPCGFRWHCEKCQRRIARRQNKRFRAAFSAHWHDAEHGWRACGRKRGERATWRLITLTIAHSGDIRRDRAALVLGWKRLRQWLWPRIGKFPFALVWELTPGRDGRGHLHAHVGALWPYLDYHELRAEWLRACPESDRINVVTGAQGARDVAHYLAKYVSKSVDTRDMPPILAARAIAANYGQRLVSTSHHFYVPRQSLCRTCGERFVLAKLPEPLRVLVPFAVWDADARRIGVDCGRGPPHSHAC